ncbi:hypothetical protein [Streptomyces sp. NPDC058953]|uniref:hypothetical protein n=1 Tax=unclassified Streptomyces TaxID=2593676 RepID=UPI00368AE061
MRRPPSGRPERGRPGRGGTGASPDRRRSESRRIDYRTPPPDWCGAAGTGTGAVSDGPGEDTLFLFLKSLHQFLTAPQDTMTTRVAPPVRTGHSPATDATAAAGENTGGRSAPDGPTGPPDPGARP